MMNPTLEEKKKFYFLVYSELSIEAQRVSLDTQLSAQS